MKDFKIDNKGSATLFSNKFLERLTRTHFAVPVTMYFVAGAATIIYAVISPEIVFRSFFWMFPLGVIVFTFVEYLIHRYIFHFEARTEKQLQLQYNIHGVHHEFPRDKDRLVMPPVMSVVLAAMFLGIFRLIFGMNGWIFWGGFVTGYSTYLMIHYAIHAWKPPHNFLKYLWTHHALHHYSRVGSAYAVSFPVWDLLFRTMPPEIREKGSPLPESAN